jgi:hypothetical protein
MIFDWWFDTGNALLAGRVYAMIAISCTTPFNGKIGTFTARPAPWKNRRKRVENRGFFAFCAVQNRQVMILPYPHIKSGSERVFRSVCTDGSNAAWHPLRIMNRKRPERTNRTLRWGNVSLLHRFGIFHLIFLEIPVEIWYNNLVGNVGWSGTRIVVQFRADYRTD